jgi:transcriptional regulator GlxA family with amidase domain
VTIQAVFDPASNLQLITSHEKSDYPLAFLKKSLESVLKSGRWLLQNMASTQAESKVNNTKNVGIFLFPDVEVLDFAGPFEVFSVAHNIFTREGKEKPWSVLTVSETGGKLLARNGLQVLADYSIKDCPHLDILIVPGGLGTQQLLDNTAVIEWIKQNAAKASYLLSVCTGSVVLGKAGLLDKVKCTTHHAAYKRLKDVAPQAEVIQDVRYVDSGKIITSGGISAGIDMSLYLVGRLLGESTMHKTMTSMEYGSWKQSKI